MASIADLQAQITGLQTAASDISTKVDALLAQIANLPPSVATQAELDGLSTQLASVQAALDAIKAK